MSVVVKYIITYTQNNIVIIAVISHNYCGLLTTQILCNITHVIQNNYKC